MSWTSHGQEIPGSVRETRSNTPATDCGGFGICGPCSEQTKNYFTAKADRKIDHDFLRRLGEVHATACFDPQACCLIGMIQDIIGEVISGHSRS